MTSHANGPENPSAGTGGGATPAHDRLNIFVGTWHTVGEILGGEAGEPMALRATDTYEWLPGGYFLIHHVDGTVDGQPVQTLEVIGHDPERGDYFSQSYDNAGSVASYRARLEGGRWQIIGEHERFDGEFAEGGRVLRGQWEQLVGGRWVGWMRLSLTRV